MSDLISRSQLLKEIETWGGCVEALHEYIENMSTAYDPNEIINELDKAKEKIATEEYCKNIIDTGDCENKDCFKCCAEYLINIVKHGGVSDDVCEWEKDEHSENDNPAEWIICPHKPKRIFSKDIKYCPYCGKKIKVVDR